MKIGLLGATGEIGTKLLKLLEPTDQIRASYHVRKPSIMAGNIEYVKLAIHNDENLEHFASPCDIIVNCAGASFVQSERIARLTAKQGCMYIDPFGDQYLQKKLEDGKEDGIFVLSCGCFPGMSGLMFRAVADHLEEISLLSGMNMDTQVPSVSAIEDFILSGMSGFGTAGVYYQNGEMIKDGKWVYLRNHHCKEVCMQHYYTKELDRIVKDIKPEKAVWYSAVFDETITDCIQKAVFEYASTQQEKCLKTYALQIQEAVRQRNSTVVPDNEIHVTLCGKTDGCEVERSLTLTSESGSDVSAFMLYGAVQYCKNHNMDKGIYYADALLDLDEMAKDFKRAGIELRGNDEFNGQLGVRVYEEGCI